MSPRQPCLLSYGLMLNYSRFPPGRCIAISNCQHGTHSADGTQQKAQERGTEQSCLEPLARERQRCCLGKVRVHRHQGQAGSPGGAQRGACRKCSGLDISLSLSLPPPLSSPPSLPSSSPPSLPLSFSPFEHKGLFLKFTELEWGGAVIYSTRPLLHLCPLSPFQGQGGEGQGLSVAAFLWICP